VIPIGPTPRPLDERWRLRYPYDTASATTTFLDTFLQPIRRAAQAGLDASLADAVLLAAYDRLLRQVERERAP
jgi:hypothetical protein